MSGLRYGIFFNMSEAEYFSIPALSASGMKLMRQSPLDYWVRSPMNKGVISINVKDETSAAMRVGSAFDARIISGKEEFSRRYAEKLDPDNFPNCLRTMEDMRAWLREAALPVSGKKDALIERVIEAQPQAQIWDLMQAAHEEEHAGKTFLDPDLISSIEVAAKMIAADAVLSKAFTDGAPQVSIVWYDDIIGVDCKCRLDYLKAHEISDLKTIANERGLPFRLAVVNEIPSRRYHVQAAFYLEGVSHVAKFLKEGLSDCANPDNDPFLKSLRADHPKTFRFVVQCTGPAKQAMSIRLPADCSLLRSAQAEIETHKQTYRLYMDELGPDLPWITPTTDSEIQEDEIAPWALM